VFKWLSGKSGPKEIEITEADGKLSSVERRRHYRVSRDIPARILVAPNKQIDAAVNDVSASGARVLARSKIQLKKKMQLELLSPGDDPADGFTISVIAVSERAVPDKEAFIYGLIFSEIQGSEQAELRDFLQTHYNIPLEKSAERRRIFRIACNVPVTYTVGDDDSKLGIIQNISASGLRLIAKEEISKYNEVVLVFSLIPEEPISLSAFVVRLQKLKNINAWAIGLSFKTLEEFQQNRLMEGLNFMYKRRKGYK
jgi:c-di-GMP-binding flagellar brake protein YcgR